MVREKETDEVVCTNFFFMCMGVMPTCMSVTQAHAVTLKAKEGIGFSRNGITTGDEPLCECENRL